MLTERIPRWQQGHWLSIARRFLSALVVLALPYSGVWGAERSASLQVDYTTSSLSVEAYHVSVQDVLVAVGDHLGFQVIMIGELNAPVIHLSVHKASVEDVLDALLGGKNYGMSYHPASGQDGHGIDKVFVVGSPESTGAVTSRVVTMGDHYPTTTEVAFPTQDSPASHTELRTRHQEIFNHLREKGALNAPQEQKQKESPNMDPNFVRQHQQEVEKARALFGTRGQAKQIQNVNRGAATPSTLARSPSALDQDLESFHDVFMDMTRQLQK